jgi:hypothetical protein
METFALSLVAVFAHDMEKYEHKITFSEKKGWWLWHMFDNYLTNRGESVRLDCLPTRKILRRKYTRLNWDNFN